MLCLVSEGHLLLEDVPGVGKTSLAKALAASIDGEFGRMQFTPDLLPSDVVGVSVFDRGSSRFEFRPGPVFANVVLADEINRASPKTQSALLESMAERQVTVDGQTHPLAPPFLVIATQNPIEHEGTYPLPESQLDRFLMRVSMGYPSRADELAILSAHAEDDVLESIRPVVTAADVHAMATAVEGRARRAGPRRVPRRPGGRHPPPPGDRPRHVAPGHPQPPAGHPGPGRRRRPRLRHARRRQGAGRAGHRPPHPRHPRGPARWRDRADALADVLRSVPIPTSHPRLTR